VNQHRRPATPLACATTVPSGARSTSASNVRRRCHSAIQRTTAITSDRPTMPATSTHTAHGGIPSSRALSKHPYVNTPITRTSVRKREAGGDTKQLTLNAAEAGIR
jgi:hypothetical protein